MNADEIVPGTAGDPDAKIRRVLVAGVSGYLGSALAVGLRNDFEVFGSYFNHPVRIEGVTSFQMNCLNGGEILDCLRRYKPDAVVYCAGISDFASCRDNAALAEGLHFKAPTVFFKILPVVLRFVFVSPDEAIGTPVTAQPPFAENVVGAPTSALARTKNQGENLTFGHKRFTAVMRTGEVFGEAFGWRSLQHTPEAAQVASPYHWLELLDWRLRHGQKMALDPTIRRSYLYVGEFVRALRLYLNAPPLESQLYHLSAQDSVSQLDFGKLYCEKMGYDPRLIVSQASASGPMNLALTNAKFSKDFDFEFQTVAAGLDELAERMRTGFTKAWT